MEKQSIRTTLKKNLGLKDEDIKRLIHMYAIRHKGKINPKEIEGDVKEIANCMLQNITDLYKDYDVAHEILECGKDRQEEALRSLLTKENYRKALEYLPNRFYINVDNWVSTFYLVAKNEFSKILEGDVEDYRKFVENLNYKNINRVANFFRMEADVVKFIARNGDIKDFQEFMTDIEPVRDSNTSERRGCPSKISKKLFESIKNKDTEEKINFNRKNIMRILSIIHKREDFSDEQKQNLEKIFIENFSDFVYDTNLSTLLNSVNSIKYETIKEYIDYSKGREEDEKTKFFLDILQNKENDELSLEYEQLMEELNEMEKSGELNLIAFKDKLVASKILNDHRNSVNIHRNDEDDSIKMNIYVPLSRNLRFRNKERGTITEVSDLKVSLDATELASFIDKVNEMSKDNAQSQMNSIIENGIGEIKLARNDYDMNRKIEYSDKDILGFLRESVNSPYIIYNGINELSATVPYYCINERLGMSKYKIEMDEEEIEKFNSKNELPEINEHSYSFGRIDGYYMRDVLDFMLDEEVIHIKEADWTNGGWYTVIWKEQDKDYPDKAMGISTSTSEWARCQSGIDEKVFIKFVCQHPLRFKKYYEKIARGSDCCGCFPAPYIETICKDILRMPTERELLEERFAQNIIDSAQEKEELTEKKSQAEELCNDYENCIGSNNTIEQK